jgi:hypothetical protein
LLEQNLNICWLRINVFIHGLEGTIRTHNITNQDNLRIRSGLSFTVAQPDCEQVTLR